MGMRSDARGRNRHTVWAPFRFAGRLSPGLVAVYVAINAVVLLNAVIHHYGVGYDAPDHQAYIRTLSQGRLPGVRFGFVLKGAQLLQVGYALVLTLFMVRICRRLRPDEAPLALAAWGSLGGMLLGHVCAATPRGYAVLVGLLGLCLLYDAPVLVTRYWQWGG